MDLHVAPESKGSSPLLEFLSASLEALWPSLLGSSWGFQLCKEHLCFRFKENQQSAAKLSWDMWKMPIGKHTPENSSGCKAVVLFGVKSWFFPTKNFKWQISHRVLVFLQTPFNKRTPWVFLVPSWWDNKRTQEDTCCPPTLAKKATIHSTFTYVQCGSLAYKLVSHWFHINVHPKSHFAMPKVYTLWCVSSNTMHTCNEHLVLSCGHKEEATPHLCFPS